MTYRKKLIEVALPLEAINAACADEKSVPRKGHPATVHLWWARRPLAACRAVLFASLVDDPGNDLPEAEANHERQKLFNLLERLVRYENSDDASLLQQARAEILKGGKPPPVLDPFCGGGSIPIEAQRLGLEAYGSDLNPIAVLVTKALIELPPLFAGRAPVNPDARRQIDGDRGWIAARGLALDVRYYGQWVRDEAGSRLGAFYPMAKLPRALGAGFGTVVAWLWARTVQCPNPACGGQMPLAKSFALSTKRGKQAWVEPVIDNKRRRVRFEVHTGQGKPPEAPKMGRGAKFRCLICTEPADEKHLKAEGVAGRLGAQLMAVIVEGPSGRVFLSPTAEDESLADRAVPRWVPEEDLAADPRNLWCADYGLRKFSDLFTKRQLFALTTFCGLIEEARQRIVNDARAAGMAQDERPLHSGGSGAVAYADAVATYLGFCVSKLADYSSTLCGYIPSYGKFRNTFGRQALPMTWDFAELNVLGDAVGNWLNHVEWVARGIEEAPCGQVGRVANCDAAAHMPEIAGVPVVCTDPPYYDNISYADLSDFFYVWLRRSIGKLHPDLFSTLLVPKAQELVASPYRHDGEKAKAEEHFVRGLSRAFEVIRSRAHPDYPVSVFYAFKQAEEDEDGGEDGRGGGVSSTGWETMLESLLRSGFVIVGTWPMRTERGSRSVSLGTNALASSIVLVCRPRSADATMATRREFVATLKEELPAALAKLQHGNIAPVDLAQASIGPGMAVFSRYAKVLEADGSPMTVRTALQLINQELDAYLTQQDGELDPDTRFCVGWFEQYSMAEARFGEADILARAKNTSVDGLVESGVVRAKAGKVRLLKREEYSDDWDPTTDRRLTVWECAQHLIRALDTGGEEKAARLSARLGGGRSEDAKALAYRLYSICDRKGWADEALAYNRLVASWDAIQTRLTAGPRGEQLRLGS